MPPFQTTTPNFSDDYKALIQRERDLMEIADKGETPADELAEMWQALAQDYAEEMKHMAAERCQRRAAKLTWT